MNRYWESTYAFNLDAGGGGAAGAGGAPAGGAVGTPGAAGPGAGGTPAPWYQGKVEDRIVGAWQNNFPQHLNDPAALAAAVTNSFLETQKFLGVPKEQLARIPLKPDDEAGWNELHKRLGKPDKAEDYVLKTADGKDLDAGLATALRAAAFKTHLPKDAAATLAAEMAKVDVARQTAAQAEYDVKIAAERTALATNWGANAAVNKEMAKAGVKALGFDADMVDALEKVVGYSKLMEVFRGVGTKTSEGQFHLAPKGQGAAQGGPMSVDQAKARKAELFADKDWAAKCDRGGVAENRELLALTTIIANGMSHAA